MCYWLVHWLEFIVEQRIEMFSQHCLFFYNQDGWTALMIAASAGQLECLSILLARGAEVNKAYEVSVPSACIE